MNARDLALLALIAEQCAVSQAQLARLIGRSEHAARWLRARWQRAGWVEGRVLLVGEPAFIWLTPKGQRACGVDFKPWRPRALGRLPHLAGCTDARLIVAERRPDAIWISERALLRTARLEGVPRTQHMPDACVALDDASVPLLARTPAVGGEWAAVLDGTLVVPAVLGLKESDWRAVLLAAITALATTLATNWMKERQRFETEKALHRAKADTDYEYEQRKKLRDAIGEYRGQLVEAATDFNSRLMNLDRNASKGWLDVKGEYDLPKGRLYYFRTTVYRFLVVASIGNRLERQALHIDSRIAEPSDLTFLLYVKALRWAVTDASLFSGVENYSEESPGDHFYADRLREMCASMYTEDDRQLRFGEFEAAMPNEQSMDALKFFDGLVPKSFRWERLTAFRLLLLAFINAFGYAHQVSPQSHFDAVAQNIETAKVAENLRAWIAKLGLGEDVEAKKIAVALNVLVPTAPPAVV